MNMATKQEIFTKHLPAWLAGSRQEKGVILTAVAQVTGMHQKAVGRRFAVLRNRDRSWRDGRGGVVHYGPDAVAALKDVWNAANQICAERLKPMIPEYIRVLERDAMWPHTANATHLLRTMSLGTIKDRIGTFERIKRRGGRGTTKPSNLKEIIPIRRGPWQNPLPGLGEVDTVAHCGYTIAGDFAYTVQYTDVATIWTCLAAQWNKGEIATVRSIERIKERLPFPLRAIDPDSGSEFINWNLKRWCDRQSVQMTRTRPYMKNDHAHIEQKNYTNVRRVVGYTRFDDPAHVPVLNELYVVLELYINFFLPSVKCIRKERTGSRTVRCYDTAQTAYQRVLAHPDIAPEVKEHLTKKYATLNPRILKERCERIVNRLIKIPTRLR